ncbi:hypothetical protein [Brevundimonas sp. NIBR11]|uniref:hypothetical protein n=1 Tax=Brevundimonas sp. NIBR11 TaxID=3015999 RepID=UPI0022F06C3E|nr:hypothetical protein [Brevundimonas sp. NIBR11]WGM32555.1 hypothetical protein KKHFBJBL_02808 [Brevundimonas sp. NIBR11]
MPAKSRLAWVLAAVLASVSTPTLACVIAPPTPDEAMAERVRNHQATLWARSDVVFLSQTSGFDRVSLTNSTAQGNSTTLVPSLALKGDLPTEPIGIRHTTFTSCGPIPFLDALSAREGDWFVIFARELPSGLSVDATVPIDELVDPQALRAWAKGSAPPAPAT